MSDTITAEAVSDAVKAADVAYSDQLFIEVQDLQAEYETRKQVEQDRPNQSRIRTALTGVKNALTKALEGIASFDQSTNTLMVGTYRSEYRASRKNLEDDVAAVTRVRDAVALLHDQMPGKGGRPRQDALHDLILCPGGPL